MRVSMRLRSSFVALFVACAAVPAAAQPVTVGEEGALAELLAPEPGASICYARTYDADHLKRHPDQTVTSVLFSLEYFRHDPDDYFPDGQRNYYFGMGVNLRDRPGLLSTGGECTLGEGTIWCGVDCDGGGVLLKREGSGVILIDLESTGRIRMNGCGGGEGDAIDLEPGLDDKVFRLEADAEACLPLEEMYPAAE